MQGRLWWALTISRKTVAEVPLTGLSFLAGSRVTSKASTTMASRGFGSSRRRGQFCGIAGVSIDWDVVSADNTVKTR